MAVNGGYRQTDMVSTPGDWQVARIGEVADFANGKPLESTVSSDGDFYLITLDSIDIAGNLKSEHKRTSSPESSLMKGDIVIILSDLAHGNLLGLCDLIPEDSRYALNQRVGRLRCHDECVPQFVRVQINRQQDFFRRRGQGTSQKHIYKRDVEELTIALPPKPEQRAIAAALTDVDGLIKALDELIAKKRLIKQGAMQELLTGRKRLASFTGEWQSRTIGEMFQFLKTANNPRSELSTSGSINYIHYGDIHTKWRTFLDCGKQVLPFVDEGYVKTIPQLEDGDLIMADASEDYDAIGVSAEISNVGNRKIVAGLHTLALRGNKALVADGFKGYLQYIPSLKSALIKIAVGISVYGVSRNNVKSISISLPDVAEQEAIAQILRDMDTEIAALEARRDKSCLLKQGMMQELLTGRIRLV